MTAPAPKRGRPPLPDDERRDVAVVLRWTAAEWAEIEAAAAALGVSRSEYVRLAALAKARRAKR